MKWTSLLLVFLLACSAGENTQEEAETSEASPSEENPETEAAEEPSENEEIASEESDNPYLVEAKSFYGVNIDDDIATLTTEKPDLLKKGLVQTGEGDFEVWVIQDENGEELADIYPTTDGSKVGMIEIGSEKAVSADGFKVGNTLADILEKFPNSLPHGSEIEGQVNIEAGGIIYRLDAYESAYDIDMEKFDKNTKVMSIIIN
ncbi:MAG: hypothetical protein AAFU64_15000 [Bacteroidota bacterium]